MTVRWWPAPQVESALRWAVALVLSVVVAMLVGLSIVAFVTAQDAAHEATAGRNLTSSAASARITALTTQVGALTDQVVQLRDQLIAAGQVPAVALPAKQTAPATTTTAVRRSTATTAPPRAATTTTAARPTTTTTEPATTTTTARPAPTTVPCRGVTVAGNCIGG